MAGEINRRIRELSKDADAKILAKEGYKVFKDTTPVAERNGGNARRNTILKNDEIIANYPYASILDKGRHSTNKGMRGSDQAPQGMTKPTVEAVLEYIKNLGKG